jgi:DNA-binding NarL/FixJ family response regulator
MEVASRPITVYLIDDQPIVRAAVRCLLSQSPDFEVLGESEGALTAVEEIARLRPDAAVLDISMPEISGIEAIALIRRVHPRIKIVMLTHHESETFVSLAMEAGADGYFSKGADLSELLLALRVVMRGDPYISPRVDRRLGSRDRPHDANPS